MVSTHVVNRISFPDRRETATRATTWGTKVHRPTNTPVVVPKLYEYAKSMVFE